MVVYKNYCRGKIVDGVAQHNLHVDHRRRHPSLAYPGTRDDAFGSVQIDCPELLMVESRQLVEHQVVCLRRHIDHRFLHRTLLRISLAQLDGGKQRHRLCVAHALERAHEVAYGAPRQLLKAVARIGKNALRQVYHRLAGSAASEQQRDKFGGGQCLHTNSQRLLPRTVLRR